MTTITGSQDVEVHASQHMVLIHATPQEAPPAAPPAAAAVNLYSAMYFRLSAGEIPGDVTMYFPYVWNFPIGSDAPSNVDPLPYPTTGLSIPEDFTGIVYLLFNVKLGEASIEYATALPAQAEDVYVRTLANVTRGTGAVTIRQRFFGLLTAPSEDPFEAGAGVF